MAYNPYSMNYNTLYNPLNSPVMASMGQTTPIRLHPALRKMRRTTALYGYKERQELKRIR